MQNPNDNDKALHDLFDATSTAASDASLHRMARQAAQIPERQRSQSWFRRARPVAFAVGLMAAGAATFLLVGDSWNHPSEPAVASKTASSGLGTEPDNSWLAELGLGEDGGLGADDEEDDDDPLAGFSLGWSASLAPLGLLQPDDEPALAEAIVVLDEINNEPR